MTQHKRRTALVTGATDGVGRVVAARLGAAGFHVLVHGRDRARGAAVVREVEQAGGSAIFLRADLASLEEVRGLATAVAAATDRLVSSAGQQAIDFADAMLARRYSGTAAYCQSKLAQILFTVDLADELKGSGVTVNALHPSTYMNTTMVRQSGTTPVSRVEDGAEAILDLAIGSGVEGRSGLYFNVLREARANGQAYDAEARASLRRLSLELTGLKE